MKSFNDLLNDPSFQIGASVLGNSGQPGIIGSALANMQRINQLKQEAQLAQRRADIEQGSLAETRRFHDIQASDLAEQRRLGQQSAQRQEELARMQIDREAQKQALQMQIMRSVAPMLGLDPSAFGAAASQPGPQPVPGGASGDGTLPPGTPQALPAPGPEGTMPPVTVVPQLPGGAHIQQVPQYPEGLSTVPSNRQGLTKQAGAAVLGMPSRFGTPSALLDSLMHVESSGNPLAVNPTSGAMGAYQFMPSTVDMLRKQGMAFNPFDAAQARNAADFYLSQLLRKNGGNWQKALADYGGFKDKDPTAYVARVMSGVNAPPAAQSGMQAPPMGNKGLDIARAGALMALGGMGGGNTLVQLGGMMKPETVPAGSYQRNPVTGETSFVGDPYREQSLANDQQRVGLEGQRLALEQQNAGREATKQQQDIAQANTKMNKEKATDTLSYQTVTDKMDRLTQAANEVLKHPGLKYNAGVWGALHVNALPGTEARDARAKLDNLKSKILVETLSDLKTASANGSSGFGQLSEKEGAVLASYIQNLDNAQSESQLRGAINDIKDFAQSSKRRYGAYYNAIYGTPSPAATPAQAQPAAQSAAMSLDEYIAKHSKK